MSATYSNRTRHKGEIESGRWADEHGLIHILLPYGYRTVTPIEALQSLRQTFKELGKYKQTFGLSHVRQYGDVLPSQKNHFELFHWAGSWAWKGWDTNNAHSYCNPIYVHDEYPAIEETSRREFLLEQTSDIPHWTDSRLGQAFGITKHGARKYRLRHGGAVEGHYNKLDKLARTVKTINHWGHTYKEIGEALPYKWKTLHKQVENNAQDFSPPSNPCVHD